MATIYADLIIKGRKKISDVPAKIREAVEKILQERGRDDLLEENQENVQENQEDLDNE